MGRLSVRRGSWIVVLALAAFAPAQTRSRTESCRDVLEAARRSGLGVGFCARFADSGSAIARSRADEPFIPASNMKVVTAGAALLGLGPAHRLYTDVVAHGAISDGVLAGPLRLRGEGDPTLAGKKVPEFLAGKVAEAGIRRIDGDLLVDDRLFDLEFSGPAWPKDAATEDYMAEVAALSLDHGTIALAVSAGPSAGSPARIRVVPENDGIRVESQLTTCTSAREHRIVVQRPPDSNVLTVTGAVVAGTRDQEIVVAIHDPALAFGHALAAALRRAGVVLSGTVRRPQPEECVSGGTLLARLETPLRDVLPLMMKMSQNHRAEMLWKHLGACLGGGGSFEGGAAAVRKVLGAAGIGLDGAELADGSGLSRRDAVSADQFVGILRALWRSPHRDVLVASLPHGGETGSTLRHRLHDLGARLHAKTGSIRGVSSLSGFVEGPGGSTVAFSILTRQERGGKLSARDVQDRLVRALARATEDR